MRAFLVRYPGAIQSLGVLPGGTASAASAINNAGQVVGYSTVAGKLRAFVWTAANGMKGLSTLPGGGDTRAYDINAGGQITGYAVAADGLRHAVLWTPQGAGYVITDLGGIPGGSHSAGQGISDAGRVVGYTQVGAVSHATIWLPPGTPPVARIAGPDTTWTGIPAEFSASGTSDPDGMIVKYEWGFNSAGAFNYSSVDPRIRHGFDLPGTRVAYVRAMDSEGSMDTAATSIVVLQNHPPVAEIGPDTIHALEGQRIRFSSAGSRDPDAGQRLRYLWTFGNGYSSRMANPVWRYVDQGSFTVTLTVTDGSPPGSVDTVHVLVANVPPTVLLRWKRVVENTPFSIVGIANDSGPVDRGGLTYSFDCGSGYGPFVAGRGTVCPGVPEGPVSVGVRVRDPDGAIGESRRTSVAQDAPPRLQLISAGQGNGTFTLAFSFSDPGSAEDAPYRYRVVWGDGTATPWVATSVGTVQVSRPAYPSGSYTLYAYVSDREWKKGSLQRVVSVP
ncbi:MAG TPA: PKD domain-containing protein, partial [Longimicrobiaceae bacterium]|nr:PKD domain-containing protein [Longimicrobiaceae bacterium]